MTTIPSFTVFSLHLGRFECNCIRWYIEEYQIQTPNLKTKLIKPSGFLEAMAKCFVEDNIIPLMRSKGGIEKCLKEAA